MKDLKKIIATALSLVCLAGCSAGGETAQESETTTESISETETETSKTVTEETTTNIEDNPEYQEFMEAVSRSEEANKEQSSYNGYMDLEQYETFLKECEELKSMTDDETLLKELDYLYEEAESQLDRSSSKFDHVTKDDAMSDYTEAVMKVHLIKNLINGENSSAISLENGILSYGNKKLDVSSLGEGSVSYKELADDEIWGMGGGFAYRISDANRSITITNYACETPDIVLKNIKMSSGGYVLKGSNTIEGTFNVNPYYDYGVIEDAEIKDLNSDDSLFNGELKAVYYTAERGIRGVSIYTAYYMYLSDSGLELLKIEYNDFDFDVASIVMGLQNMQEIGFPEICNKIVRDFTITSDTSKPENNDFTDNSEEETQAELSEGQSLVVKDLNGDGRDEEIFSYNPFGLCDITYYDSADTKQTISFDVMSVWGGTWYLSDTNQILNLKFYAHSDGTGTGFEMDLYDFSGADIKLLHTYSADGGYVLENGGMPSEMTYTIDGKDYSAGDFISEAAALSELCEKELGYPLFVKDSRNENNYIINSELPNSCGCNMLS